MRLGIDLGGTKIASGAVDDNGTILFRNTVKTRAHQGTQAVVADISESVLQLCKQAQMGIGDFDAIGAGIPGKLDCENNIVISAANLGLRNAPLKQMLSMALGREVAMVNDAQAALIGEMHFGAAKDTSNVVMLTLGTGVGGAVIVGGKLLEGSYASACELGHTVIKMGGRACACGRKGCLEAYCSAAALIKDTKKAMRKHKESLLWQTAGGDLSGVCGETAFKAALSGDKVAFDLIDNYTDRLAEGLANFVLIFRPQVILIGGGLSGAGDKLLHPLREKTYSKLHDDDVMMPDIRCAQLGNDAGIVGAAAYTIGTPR